MKKKTKHILRLLLAAGTIVSLFFVPWVLVRAWITPLPDTVQGQLEEALTHGFDGIIVYTDQPGKPPRFYAAGWHNRKSKIPAYPHALFKIASIRKLYDAVAVTKLVSDRRLSLDNTLADYLPALADRIKYADEITLRMLVKHRSGIQNVTNTPDYWTDPPKSSEEALERIFDQPANFKPGEDYEYSNTNYLLISAIIETVTGASPFQYIKEKILSPLALENTYPSIHTIDMDKLMSGYYVGIEEDIKTADYGSMIATAEDVGIFLRALNEGSIFNGEERDIYDKLYQYGHTGLIPGYQSIAKYHQDSNTVVVQFVNTTNFDGYTWNLSEIVYSRILKILKTQ